MGIILNLFLKPRKIPAEEWKKAYRESLALADAAKLLNPDAWELNEESFRLSAYIEDYQTKEETGKDVLGALYEDNETGAVNVWGAKAQGRGGDIPLLATGCLMSDRFPGAAIVTGDFDLKQCEDTVAWANGILRKPIKTPVTCRPGELVKQLSEAGLEGAELIEAAQYWAKEGRERELGQVIMKSVNEEDICRWIEGKLRNFGNPDPDMWEYLGMGLPFDILFRAAVTERGGRKMKKEGFVMEIMWIAAEAARRKVIEKYPSLRNRAMDGVMGAKRPALVMSVDELEEACRERVGDRVDVRAIREEMFGRVGMDIYGEPINRPEDYEGSIIWRQQG